MRTRAALRRTDCTAAVLDRVLGWRMVEPLTSAGMSLQAVDAHAMAVAHGQFQDLLTGDRLRIRGHDALDRAARETQERRLAGAQAVDRYQGVDQAPLVAAELAVWALLGVPRVESWGFYE